MQMSMIAVLILATVTITGSSRVKVQDKVDKAEGPMARCNAVGDSVMGGHMSVTWGIPKSQCTAKCGPTRSTGSGLSYVEEFTNAFTIGFNLKCECFAGGKKMIRFQPRNKAQAMACAADDDDQEIKKECWKMYMKARGTRKVAHGSAKVPYYKAPWTDSDFVVNRMCSDVCEGDACFEVTLPGAIEGMDHDEKAAIGDAAKMLMDGKAEEISEALKELLEVLPESDLDAAEFAAIDIDGDGQLSVEELALFFTKFTTEQIQGFVDAVDENGSGDIDPEEFSAFKDQMRAFDSKVDLLTGKTAFTKDEFGGLQNNEAKWTVTKVECMKAGKPAPGECEGGEDGHDDAIMHFEENC